MTDKTEDKKIEKTFLKESFIKSDSFKNKKDLLCVLLEDGKAYTKKEVCSIIDNYLKRSGF